MVFPATQGAVREPPIRVQHLSLSRLKVANLKINLVKAEHSKAAVCKCCMLLWIWRNRHNHNVDLLYWIWIILFYNNLFWHLTSLTSPVKMHTAKGKQMSCLTRDERIVIEFSRGYYFCKKQGDWMQKLTTSLSFLKLYSKPLSIK